MKAFNFSLQPLLVIRKSEKDIAAKNLQLVTQKKQMIQSILDQKKDAINDLCIDLNAMIKEGISAGMKANYNESMLNLRIELNRLMNDLDRCKIEEQEMTMIFLKAHEKEQAILKIKDKKYQKYLKEFQYLEERETENILNARYTNHSIIL